MLLPNSVIRNAIGIDTFERAVAWSALLLRSAYFASSDRAVQDAIQIGLNLNNTADGFVSNMVIRAVLSVTNNALIDGGDVLANITEQMSGSVSYTGANLSPSSGGLPITEPPAFVDTLEQYFYWASQQLLAQDVTKYRSFTIAPTFRGITNPFTIDNVVLIPFDYAHYLINNNLVGAIYPSQPEETNLGQLNNDSQLSNDHQLTNGSDNSNESGQLSNDVQLSNNNQLVN
ncbi:hypothetical protein VKI21_06790 [Cyanobacterium aponinum UTEX 3222]|uniref:hypothetical protein n=1 Tax=Cyanobacterium aponinum TaxID=379064 RepID=UPI002B4BB3EB|nr:hypothetical protein [Cyanobacterium aponinum]WRL37048.1 hypothetical protein VKI22_10440 [Cyanobacterium aponinum UTEX 3221]WRL43383.1 hypothetical protein VKI21_06790 [Cyanobacterium aponinum UTEX 3222]